MAWAEELACRLVRERLTVAEGGPGLAGPTGATVKTSGPRTKLDTEGKPDLIRSMKNARRKSLESEVAELAKRREQKRGELEAMAERITERMQLGKPATARMLERMEQMRAEYQSIQRRHALRQAEAPATAPTDEDF